MGEERAEGRSRFAAENRAEGDAQHFLLSARLSFSKQTIVCFFCVVLSSAFTQHLRVFGESVIGAGGVSNLLSVVGVLSGGALLWLGVRRKRVVTTLLLCGAVGFGALSLETAVERVHVITGAIFGAFVYRDHCHLPLSERLFVFVLLSPLLAVGEELFQYFLPSRVADVRDILIGIPSMLVGTAFGAVFSTRMRKNGGEGTK